MAVSFSINPAAGLTPNKVPMSAAGGRLADSPVGVDAGFGYVRVSYASSSSSISQRWEHGENAFHIAYTGNGWALNAFGQKPLMFYTANTFRQSIHANGRVTIGAGTDYNNGLVQLASHSALTGGYAFGTATDGTETLWRHAAGVLRTAGTLRADVGLDVNGVTRINTTQPTYSVTGGTTTRTLSSVTVSGSTTPELNVAFGKLYDYISTIVADLKAIGIYA